MPPTAYRIVTLPKLDEEACGNDSEALSLAYTFRDFRLLALKTAPAAFAASYHEERQRSLDQTIERLTNIKATHFVALSCGDSDSSADAAVYEATVEHLLSNDWHGTIVILGPQNESSEPVTARTDPFAAMTVATTEGPGTTPQEQSKLHYHLSGMFVVPTARGSGLGRRLIEVALGKAKADGQRLERDGVCTIIVDEWNEDARRLYEKCGFAVVSKETYVQRPRGLIQGESQSEEHVALRMEYRFSYEGAA